MTRHQYDQPMELPKWGRVATDAESPALWLLVEPSGRPVQPVREFLIDFVVRNRPLSTRSYAFALLRWWRWMRILDREWNHATPADARDFALLLARIQKPRSHPRTESANTAGTINSITRKPYLDDQYKPATGRHGNAVIRSFYNYWIEQGEGPLLNPFQTIEQRANAHHNPLAAFKGNSLRYNPKVPKRHPRSVPDEERNALFQALRSHRDRALLSLAVSNGARASEVLGLRGLDVDWGGQLVRVIRKGTRVEQWLPVSPEALIWLCLYLAQVPSLGPGSLLWVTLRKRDHGSGMRHQELNYDALRAVFRRANKALGTNWSMHDLRHTAALRMSRDSNLTLRDVQTILGHKSLETTAQIYLYENEIDVARRVLAHIEQRQNASDVVEQPTSETMYDQRDMTNPLRKATPMTTAIVPAAIALPDPEAITHGQDARASRVGPHDHASVDEILRLLPKIPDWKQQPHTKDPCPHRCRYESHRRVQRLTDLRTPRFA